LGARDTRGSTTTISAGDLLLVIQMQGAQIAIDNDMRYGTGLGTAGNQTLPGSGNNGTSFVAGQYEYVIAQNAVGDAGGVLNTTSGLANSYSTAAFGAQGQVRFQVVRVPQYSSATLGGTVTAPAWNGSSGGVAALDVAGSLNLNGNTIDVTGLGFRGGAGLQMGGDNTHNNLDYRTLAPIPGNIPNQTTGAGGTAPAPRNGLNTLNGSKGEGIAGTPRYVNVLIGPIPIPSLVDTGVQGYPSGSMGRGAPGNAGGGGTDGGPATNEFNSGGGGGGNGGVGGNGGNSYRQNVADGGWGGSAFGSSGTSAVAPTRLVMGGGGGAGTNNNGTYSRYNGTTVQDNPQTGANAVAQLGFPPALLSSGQPGGGIVMVRAGTVVGTGTINARGRSAYRVTTSPNANAIYEVNWDGGGGGGAGGSVVVVAQNASTPTLTINAQGGDGGNTNHQRAGTPPPHGPGGGGGGGVVYTSFPIANAVNAVLGGIHGWSNNALPDPAWNSQFNTADGSAGVINTTTTAADTVNSVSGAACLPALTVVKTTITPGPLTVPNTATYTITVSNAAGTGVATGASVSDVLPAGFTYASNLDPVYAGGASGPASIGNSGTPSVPVFGVAGGDPTSSFSLPGGASVSVTFNANIAASVAPGVYQNPAEVDYTDPTRTAEGQTITPGASYASGGGTAAGSNYDPASSTGEDVEIVAAAPGLALVKSASPATYDAVADMIHYSYLVTNSGNVPLAGPFSVADDRATDESCPVTASLDPGESITCSASYAITQADLDAGSVTNTATASGSYGGNPVNSAPDDETVTADQSPALTILKSAVPATYAAVGDVIGYSYLVTNSGNVTLAGPFTVDDDLAADESCPATGTLPPGDTLTCTASYAITQTDLDLGSVTNTATATNGVVTSLSDEETVTAVQSAAIEMIKQISVDGGVSWQDGDTPPGPALVSGTDPQFRLTMTNLGNVTLDNLSLTDSDFDTSGCALPASLAPTDSFSCVLAAPWALGQHTDTATASGEFGGTAYSDADDANYLGTLPVVTDPAVTKSGDPATAAVGDTVTFTVIVSNAGPGDAEGVVVVDPIPAFLDISLISIAPTNPAITIGISGNTITFGFPPLAAGDSYTITIRTIVNALGTPPGGTNTATLSTTSVDSDPDNNADSALVTIVIRPPSAAPETGFAPGRRTLLPSQPAAASYADLGDLWLEIPTLGVRRPITGVPRQAEGWDVKWLGDLAGYLEGTAFPTWSGNSVITGHVVLATGLPGPFARLDRLSYGESIVIHAWGQHYRYEVREVALLSPIDPSIFRHEERDWVTLVTCQGFDPVSGTYRARRVVRTVLMEIDGETVVDPPAVERGR